IHKLAELRGAEEFFHNRRSRLVVDEVVRQERVDILELQTLADGALDTQKTDAVLVFQKLADSAHPTVTEVVNVVDLAVAVFQLQQVANGLKDVFFGQGALFQSQVEAQTLVELQAADRAEVVAVRIEEQVIKEDFRRIDGRRIARAQALVDLEDRFVLRGDAV